MRATGVGPGRLTVFLLFMMLVLHNMQRTAVVPIFVPLQDRLGTDYAGVGALFAAYVLGYAVLQMVAGLAHTQLNPRVLLLAGLAASAALSLAFALAESYPVALILRFLLGAIGAALYTPSLSVAITGFEPSRRGRVMGLMQSGAGIGSIAALTALPVACSLLGMTGGLMTLPILCGLTYVVVALRFDAAVDHAPTSVSDSDGAGFGRGRAFWQLLAVSFVGMLATYGLLVWLPTYLTDAFGYSTVSAGSLAAIPSLALMVAAPAVGRLADLHDGRFRVVMGGSLMAVVCYALLGVLHLPALVLLLSALIGISLAATTAPFILLAGECFKRQIVSRVVALMAAVAQGGATLAGVLFGIVLSHGSGFDAVWVVCAVLAGIRVVTLIPAAGRRANHVAPAG